MPKTETLIEQHQSDIDTLLTIGMRSAKRIGVHSRVAVLRAYLGRDDVIVALRREWAALQPLVVDAMVAGHLAGRLRTLMVVTEHIAEGKSFSPYDAANEFMRKRLELPPESLQSLRNTYGDTATHVTRNMGSVIEGKAKKAVAEITAEGMHAREGVVHLRRAFEAAGIEATKPWLLETLVRTQVQLAYGAGRWNANQDTAIREILWGYEYVTAGDDRVRANHEAMEGARYPKDHPFWSENWPPNGFSCRCDALEIFTNQAKSSMNPLPREVTIDGQKVLPGADEGWKYNPGAIYRDKLPPKAVTKIKPPKTKAVLPKQPVTLLDRIRPKKARIKSYTTEAEKGEFYKDFDAYKADLRKYIDQKIPNLNTKNLTYSQKEAMERRFKEAFLDQKWHDKRTFSKSCEWDEMRMPTVPLKKGVRFLDGVTNPTVAEEMAGKWGNMTVKVMPKPYRSESIVEYRLLRLQKGANTKTCLHEFGHLFEADRSIRRKSLWWVKRRAKSPKQVKLNTLKGWERYGDDEYVYINDFTSRYVGKVYDDWTTEAFSTGLAHFRSAQGMVSLARNDFDQFSYIYGTLVGAL